MSPVKKNKTIGVRALHESTVVKKKKGTGVGALHESPSVVASELPSSLAAVPGTSVQGLKLLVYEALSY